MVQPSKPARKRRKPEPLRNETVIKCCLMKYLRYSDQHVREKIQEAIDVRVNLYSQRVNLASLAFMTYLKEEKGAISKDTAGIPIHGQRGLQQTCYQQ